MGGGGWGDTILGMRCLLGAYMFRDLASASGRLSRQGHPALGVDRPTVLRRIAKWLTVLAFSRTSNHGKWELHLGQSYPLGDSSQAS